MNQTEKLWHNASNFYLCEILEKNVFQDFFWKPYYANVENSAKCLRFWKITHVGEIFDFRGNTFVLGSFSRKYFRPNSTSAWAVTVGLRGSRRFSLAAASIGRPGLFTYQTRSGTSSTSCSRRTNNAWSVLTEGSCMQKTQCCGSGMFIPHPGSTSKNASIFTQ